MGRQTLAIRDERIASSARPGGAGRPLRERATPCGPGETGRARSPSSTGSSRPTRTAPRPTSLGAGRSSALATSAPSTTPAPTSSSRASAIGLSPYMALLGFLSAKRAGKEEDAQTFLDEAIARLRGDAWPLPVLRFFRHEISPTSLLEGRDERDPGDRGPRLPRPRPAEPRRSQGRDRASDLGPRPRRLPVDRRPTWRRPRWSGSTRGRRSPGEPRERKKAGQLACVEAFPACRSPG